MNNKIGYGELSEAREQSKITNKDLDMQWIVIAGALTYWWRIYELEVLSNKVTSLFHDNPQYCRLRALRTAELVSRDFY